MAIGIKAGRAMKPLLEELYELQLENRFQTKDDALQWVKGKYLLKP
jgi:hypothetical protein